MTDEKPKKQTKKPSTPATKVDHKVQPKRGTRKKDSDK